MVLFVVLFVRSGGRTDHRAVTVGLGSGTDGATGLDGRFLVDGIGATKTTTPNAAGTMAVRFGSRQMRARIGNSGIAAVTQPSIAVTQPV